MLSFTFTRSLSKFLARSEIFFWYKGIDPEKAVFLDRTDIFPKEHQDSGSIGVDKEKSGNKSNAKYYPKNKVRNAESNQ